jgi:hypothetical protein
MILFFPNSTRSIMSANPRILADAVLARLRVLSLLGDIREIRGTWYSIRKDHDEDLQRAHSNNLPRRSRATMPNCIVCSKPCSRTRSKFCSVACHAKHQRKPRAKCKRSGCANLVKKPEKIFCSLDCCNEYKRGVRTGPRNKQWHWRKRRMVA